MQQPLLSYFSVFSYAHPQIRNPPDSGFWVDRDAARLVHPLQFPEIKPECGHSVFNFMNLQGCAVI